MKRVLKPVVALVAAAGLLSFFVATPSAASTATLTGGTLTVNLTPPIVQTVGTTGTGTDCGSSFTLLDNSTGALGSTPLAGTFAFTIDTSFTYNSTNYHFVATSTGTYASTHSGGNAYAVTATLNVTGNIYNPASQTAPCASGTRICGPIASTAVTLTGTANLTAVHPGPLGTITGLGGSKTLSAFGCTAPFSAMHGKTATLSGVSATLP